jgi:hypothetical protein
MTGFLKRCSHLFGKPRPIQRGGIIDRINAADRELHRWRLRRCRFEFVPRDFWIGVFWKKGREPYWPAISLTDALDIYICILPMVPFHIRFTRFLKIKCPQKKCPVVEFTIAPPCGTVVPIPSIPKGKIR